MIDELKQVLCLVQKYDYDRAIGFNNAEPTIFVCGTEVKAEARHTGAGPLAHDAPLYGCGDDVALTRPTTSKPHMADKAAHGIRKTTALPACTEPQRRPAATEFPAGGLHRCLFFLPRAGRAGLDQTNDE